jgi:hypothetical protein
VRCEEDAPKCRVCVCIHRDECACVVSASDILYNSEKNDER